MTTLQERLRDMAGWYERRQYKSGALANDAADAIDELVAVLEKVPNSVNNAFAAGTEEREGGSADRQGRLIDRCEAVLEQARALVTKYKAGSE